MVSSQSKESLSNQFAIFFVEKVDKLRQSIPQSENTTLHFLHFSPPHTITQLKLFAPTATDEITEIVLSSSDKCCRLDPISSDLLKKCIIVLARVIVEIVNRSLSSGCVLMSIKHAVVTPLHKKPSLDKEVLSNYRPVSNLSYLSKILEQVMLKRLKQYM